ncbi:putative GABA permease [Polychaeton citri CBS 116435]|uniref:GABA permease n=1 Tax=Polychaeton citri CBS 116435 TaxID=1314669 RepID=A0A9P4Q9R9_9PEZI|nr:putative GABA permease [Polychaeton citri CBS 116435]
MDKNAGIELHLKPTAGIGDVSVSDGLKSTNQDAIDMQRLGRKQELKRNFTSFSILGFASIIQLTWPSVISSSAFGLLNGGRAGTIYVFIGVWFCMFAVAASLGELCSMAPTAAGQYHWVSEFGPPRFQRFLSFVVGWLSALGWQACLAVGAYSAATLTLELVSLNIPSYTPAAWHGTLTTVAYGLFATVFNIYLARRLPMIEGVILFLFVFGFAATIVPLWVTAPKAGTSEVFGEFANYGGWPTIGAATVVGSLTSVSSFFGTDSPAHEIHMAEEIRNASRVMPRVMMSAVALNGCMGLVVLITLMYVVTDIKTMVADSTSTFPFIGIFCYATGSRAGATGMACIELIMSAACAISALAVASRQAWSFSRDNGLPFSGWFRKVTNIGTPIPLNSILASLFITVIIALINLGGTQAYNSILGLLTGSAGFSYILSIGCVLLKRIKGEPLPESSFSLGKWGIPINLLAIGFTFFQVIISFFPMYKETTAENMNWGWAMFVGVTLIATVYYIAHGRKVYTGPVLLIRKE